MKISELAKLVGIHETTIRRLEREGVIKADRTITGHRIFTAESAQKILDLYRKRRNASNR
jgi:excisionase family DNA binding protein